MVMTHTCAKTQGQMSGGSKLRMENRTDRHDQVLSMRRYASVVLAVVLCRSVYLSQVGVPLKRLDESSYATLCCKEIQASTKIAVLHS